MTGFPRLKILLSPLWHQMRIGSQQLEESQSYVMDIADDLILQLEENPQDFLTFRLQRLIKGPLRALNAKR